MCPEDTHAISVAKIDIFCRLKMTYFHTGQKFWTLVLSHCPDSPDNDQISCAVVSIVFIIVSGIYLQKTNSQGLLGTFQVRTKP